MSNKFVKINNKLYQTDGIDTVEIIVNSSIPITYAIFVNKLPVVGGNGRGEFCNGVYVQPPSYVDVDTARAELNRILKEIA